MCIDVEGSFDMNMCRFVTVVRYGERTGKVCVNLASIKKKWGEEMG